MFLGTAAAEGYPGLFCCCDNCTEAKRLGGPNLRARSSILVDGELLVDIPPDILSRVHSARIDLCNLRALLVTHSHPDHFSFHQLVFRRHPFALTEIEELTVVGSPVVAGLIRERYSDKLEDMKIELLPLEPFGTVQVGGCRVTSIEAVHKTDYPEETSYNYIIERGGKSLLYACDTGPYGDDVLDFLKDFEIDAAILECTMCFHTSKVFAYHMGFEEVFSLSKWLREHPLRAGGRIIATHFSHGSCPPHEELSGILGREGVEAAYDFMEFEI